MPTMPLTRTRSLPLDGARALNAALELASEVAAEVGLDFDRALGRVEMAVARCRAAFLATDHPEADAALRYHERANQELADGFMPLYYRKAVLDNVVARYHRAGHAVTQQARHMA